MVNKRIAVFGCKSTTKFLVEELLKFIKVDLIISIGKDLAGKNQVADYMELSDFARQKEIDIYFAETYNLQSDRDHETIKSYSLDIAFVNGWQRIIPQLVLDCFSVGVFGMHGSSMDLPRGRGRSPLNWSILEGRSHFYTNLFKYDSGIDSGKILDTYKFQILNTDTAETLHFKNSLSMISLIRNNIDRILENSFTLKQQSDKILPTYYPKRTPQDSMIDFSAGLSEIEKFIRAVAPPFGGAFSFINGIHKLTIYRASIFDFQEFYFQLNAIGQIVKVFPNGKFLIMCFGGLLLIHDYDSEVPLEEGQILSNESEIIMNYFPRNEYGYFDMPEKGL